MRRAVLILPLLVAACNSGGSSSGNAGLEAQSQALMVAVLKVGRGAQQAVPAFLAPALAAVKGITVTPGAAADSYMFHVPVDTDDDGTNDATLDGTVTLSGGLFTFGPGFGGTVDVIATLGGSQSISANLNFRMAANGTLELWGTGSLSDSTAGTDVSFSIDQATPLALVIVIDQPVVAGAGVVPVANLCELSGQGAVRVTAYSNSNEVLTYYSALWTLRFDQKPIAVTEAMLSGSDETQTPLPDSTFEVECPAKTIQDWAGTYDFNWFCNPEEEGTSVLVITVTGPDTIHIVDGDLEYDATAVPGNPHVVQGFFIDNGLYREDFVWTLSRDGKAFTQQSAYELLPPSTGGGICGGGAVKR